MLEKDKKVINYARARLVETWEAGGLMDYYLSIRRNEKFMKIREKLQIWLGWFLINFFWEFNLKLIYGHYMHLVAAMQ